MSINHILVKELDTDYWSRFSHLYDTVDDAIADGCVLYKLECPGPDNCSGYEECFKAHEVDGVSADDGPYDSPEDSPWDGWDEFEFHGVEHTWHDGYNWTVPFKGCVVSASDYEPPDEVYKAPLGRYEVEIEWDNEYCYLNYIGPA